MTAEQIVELIDMAILRARATLNAADKLLASMTYMDPDFDIVYQIVKDTRRYIEDQESNLMLYTNGRL